MNTQDRAVVLDIDGIDLRLVCVRTVERCAGPDTTTAAMAISSVTVVVNALRLRRYRPKRAAAYSTVGTAGSVAPVNV
jgi:hypothetical protein